MGGSRFQNSIFLHFRVPFDYPLHSLQETVLPQTNYTNGNKGVAFVNVESLWPGIWEI